jgi:integrase
VGLRYYDAQGVRQRKSPFPSKSAALTYYRGVIELGLRGEPAAKPDLTFAEFVALYIGRHAADVRPRTIATLTERLRHAERRFGDVTLHQLERMIDEIADWQAKQPSGIRYGRVQALRQTLEAAVRWGYMHTNPAELAGRVLNVRRTVSSNAVVELGKTNRSRRQVPLSPRAIGAIDALPPRLDTPLLFAAPGIGVLNLNNFRNRVWTPAIEASGVSKPARIYDLRSTFASNALAAGITVFELARVMRTSVEMIERHYGALLDGSGASMTTRLAAFEAEQERAEQWATTGAD